MQLTYQLGRIMLCLAITFQGLYVMGYLPNQALLNSMTKGIKNFESATGFYHQYLTLAAANIGIVAKVIGGLLAVAALNILSTSRFIIQLNILGLLLLTCFVGIPYRVMKGEISFLDPTDKTLFHLFANLSIVGGLWYYYETSKPVEAPKREKQD